MTTIHQWEFKPSELQESQEETKETSARKDRVDIRVYTPKQNIEHLFSTKNYKQSINVHNAFMREFCKNPFDVYSEMRTRLNNEGETASFQREFEGVVGFLTEYLFQHQVTQKTDDVIENPCAVWFSEQTVLHDQLIPALVGIQIETRYMYPYRATLYVIQRMLSIIDQYHRTQTAVKLPPYYHNFRYEYYLTLLTDVARTDIVLIPTCSYVGATVLIKIRCVPVHIIGVVCKPTYADQYVNSPLDFWAHDVNHARRTMLETERYYDSFVKHRTYFTKRNYWANVSVMDFYREMETFTQQTLLPVFKSNKRARLLRNMKNRSRVEEYDYKIESYKALKRIIIFEITHEKAWPITPDSILRNIVMGYDRFPVESIEVEHNNIKTHDFVFNDPTTLSNTIHKLRGGFYDDPNNINAAIVPLEYRTSLHLAKAALELFEHIAVQHAPQITRPSLPLLLALATDPHDTEEFRDGDIVNVIDIEQQAYPTETYIRPRPEDFIPGRI